VISSEKIKAVIWLQPTFLGDSVLTTAAIDALHSYNKKIDQFFIVNSEISDIFLNHPQIKSVISFEKQDPYIWKTFRKVKQKLLQTLPNNLISSNILILQPHRSFRSHLLAWYLGYQSVCYHESAFPFLASFKVHRIGVLWEFQRIALLLTALDIPRSVAFSGLPRLAKIKNKIPFFSTIGHSQKVIAVVPGSEWPTKCWPVNYYQQLIHILLGNFNGYVALLGNQKDQSICQQIIEGMKNQDKLINLAGKTRIRDLLSIYYRLALVITNDSAASHLAAAHNTPCVTIFGPTIPEMGFSPLSSHSIIIENKGCTCRPCGLHGHKKCPQKHFKCMNNILPINVWKKIKTKYPYIFSNQTETL